MGEGLYLNEPLYRAHVDRMCVTLTPVLGFDLRGWLFPSSPPETETSEGWRAAFNAPRVTQPAIFVTELALGCFLLDLGLDLLLRLDLGLASGLALASGLHSD